VRQYNNDTSSGESMKFSNRASNVRVASAAWLTVCIASCGGGSGGSSMPPTFTVGGTLSGLVPGEQATLDNNGADALIVSTNGAFTFKTPLAQNASYAVTVSAQPPGQMCSVSGASGTGVTVNVATVIVTCQDLPQYAYAVNTDDNTVSQYSISSTGQLTPLSPPTVATGLAPQSVTVNSALHTAYVTNLNDNNISQYAVQANGTLAPMTPATVPAGRGPRALAIDTSSNTAFVVNTYENTLYLYEIRASGVLNPYFNPAPTGSGPRDVVLNSKIIFVTNESDFTVSQYQQSETGLLLRNSVRTGASPAGITVCNRFHYTYVANAGDNTISEYDSAGTLVPLAPAFINGGSQPNSIAVDPSNLYAYVSNAQPGAAGAVYQYTIGVGGQLIPMANPYVAAGSGPAWITLDQFGRYAYAVNRIDGTISEYTIGADGALTPLGTVPTGNGPLSMTTSY
jgi:6-phosphogluconolactonase